MIDLRDLARFEKRLPTCGPNTALAGCFDIPCSATGSTLRVIASAVLDWDHVSVSHRTRCPNWPEMARVKALFFRPDESAMQLHVPEADHVNNHPFCLHLWRPHLVAIPRPPAEFVGVAGMTPEQMRRLSPSQREAVRSEAGKRLFGGAHG